jgi:hydrogenase maturation protease
MSVPPRVLIAGLGNIFLGDDAFGVYLAQRLAQRSWPSEVQVVDFGIRSFDLAFALLDGFGLAILVDALSRGGPPGKLYVIEPNLEGQAAVEVNTHSMDPARVLQLVRAYGTPTGRILVVGCEPATLEPDEEGRMNLSEPVQAALDEAERMVEVLVREYLGVSTGSDRTISEGVVQK